MTIAHLKDNCEGIDAAVFSGDMLAYPETASLDMLKMYMARWQRAIDEHCGVATASLAAEPAPIMTYDQAATLFRSINVGYPLGADSEGNIVTTDTKLGLGMEILGYRSYLPRADVPKPVTGQAWHPWDTKQAVEFLRGWALALSKGTVV